MKIVLQRVSNAMVKVEGNEISKINRGLLLLVGIEKKDGDKEIEYLSRKVVNLRIFPDDAGKMNLSVIDVKGEILVVSQFTLVSDWKKGNRPSFAEAAPPDYAIPILDRFIKSIEDKGIRVFQGKFGAHMEVFLCNDGPVTFFLEV